MNCRIKLIFELIIMKISKEDISIVKWLRSRTKARETSPELRSA